MRPCGDENRIHRTDTAGTTAETGAYPAPNEPQFAVKQTTMNAVVHAMKNRRKPQSFGVAHTPHELPVLISETVTMQTAIHQVEYERIYQPFCPTGEQTETAVSSKRKSGEEHDTYPAFQPEGNCPLPRSLAARQKYRTAIRRRSDENQMSFRQKP